jgi:hypothetical protein
MRIFASASRRAERIRLNDFLTRSTLIHNNGGAFFSASRRGQAARPTIEKR